MREPLVWTCHVCGEERPDERISVHSSTVDLGRGITMTHNVRYCNDREECREGAPSVIFKGKPDRD